MLRKRFIRGAAMKSFIVTIAALILAVNIWLVTNDLMTMNRHTSELKFICAQASVGGALYTEDDEYENGIIKFNDDEVLKSVKDIVCKNMNLDDSQIPTSNSYWKATVEITVDIYDDVSCREYIDGVLTQETTFEYPYLHTDAETGFSQAIARPTVCVKVNAGVRPIGGGFMRLTPKIVRSAAHELVGR